MGWNWQQPDWPSFTWDERRLAPAEREFLLNGGVLVGTVNHLGDDEQTHLTIESLCTEALTTSEIEGELLDRASVQSSIRRQLGLATDNRRVRPQERGIAEMMVDVYRTPAVALSEEMLCAWHRMVMSDAHASLDAGKYRTGDSAMQVVSGNLADPKVHFEAPPSSRVPDEMARFLTWFNQRGPDGSQTLPALTRAGIAHLYFESIHPFEDGNGRIGRAVSEKSIAQSLGQPIVTTLAATILSRRKEYYAALEAASRQNEITGWLAWFAGVAIEGSRRTLALAEFLVDKAKLFDRLTGLLNERQVKALLRMFQEGPAGFKGGLSAGNYAAITRASPATATRDLADLVEKEALVRTGEHKHARYHLAIPSRPVKRVTVGKHGELVEAGEA